MEKKTAKITIKCGPKFKRQFTAHCQRQQLTESWVGLRYLETGMKEPGNGGRATALAKRKRKN